MAVAGGRGGQKGLIPMNDAKIPPLLAVRAEAGAAIGTGHVMRMLALAQAWQDAGGQVVFFFGKANEPLQLRLEAEHCRTEVLGEQTGSPADAAAVVFRLALLKPDWLAVDGYAFDRRYFEKLAAASVPILAMADYPVGRNLPVTVLLNQNAQARAEDYIGMAPGARLLLGLNYVLLRREFQPWQSRRPVRSGRTRHLLVTLGGSDPDNVTSRVVQALAPVADAVEGITVVVGANNPWRSEIAAAVAAAGAKVALQDSVANMTLLLSECDLAVCAGGSTCWEMAYMGVPVLAIVLAENQAPLAAEVERLGCGLNLGWWRQQAGEKLAQAIRQLGGEAGRVAAMARRGRELVDGRGAARVVECLRGARV